ncbi:MAG: oxaloacetate decarboxylase [Lachnospiraceae bacterium]|nr:oxaloacetate decarboxylase [Lachnospiraceae bacterium]
MKKTVLLIVGVLGVIIAGVCIALWRKSQAAISMIGEVDGPTAVFVAGKINPTFIIARIILWLKRR